MKINIKNLLNWKKKLKVLFQQLTFNKNFITYTEKNKRNEKSKIKRNRTSFKPDQLRQMKEYFKRNMNPDSKELRELAFETGLNKRVLQVIF